jgi:hypothetical protein
MKDWDPNDPDPTSWLEELAEWREQQRLAREQQQADRAALDAAQARVSTLTDWRDRLTAAAQMTGNRATHLAADAADVTATDAAVSDLNAEILDHTEAREIATARLLAAPSTGVPITLLPLRLQTSWTDRTLSVRIYPDAVSVDSHDERLTVDEVAAGKAYWAMRGSGGSAATDQAWGNLVRRVGAQRAAWVVRATDPSSPPAAANRTSAWETSVNARLLPERFAVVAYAAGEPINVAAPAQPPRYVTWGAAVPDPLPIDALHEPTDDTWLTDLASAVDMGMAVRIAVPETAPAIEQLLVIGVRTRAAEPADPAALLEAHAYTGGVEILLDGIPTNNTKDTRAAHSLRRDADVAADLIDPNRPADLADGTAGAQLADVLGVPRRRVAAFTGADAPRAVAASAARLLVGTAVQGPMQELLGTDDASAVWALLTPAGPAPAVRVGRQPYGILPGTAPGRWQPAAGEAAAPLAALMQWWGHVRGPAVDLDPAAPPVDAPSPRQVTRVDQSQLAELLVEHAASIAWSDGTSTFTGLDGLVGPAEGAQAPAAYLLALADAAVADLPTIEATLPPALLAKLALAAKRLTPDSGRDALKAALRTLAAHTAHVGREDLARLVSEHLDAVCRRLDAWFTAASTERLLAQRAATAADPLPAPAVGAYGYLTDVQPRTEPRSHGHVHAPSLAHAATAAVLRSGYLGQRRARWASVVVEARAQLRAAQQALDDWDAGEPDEILPNGKPNPQWQAWKHVRTQRAVAVDAARGSVAAAEAELAALRPLDVATEKALPLAIDLSSRRVRQARWVLAAVRTGQPLAAVLGYQFERDLADAALQRYLAAFRKLTRFRTGTQLEALEDTHRDKHVELDLALRHLADLRATAAQTVAAVEATATALTKAREAEQSARTTAAPYVALQAELADLVTRSIPQLQAALDAVNATRLNPRVEHRKIQVP